VSGALEQQQQQATTIILVEVQVAAFKFIAGEGVCVLKFAILQEQYSIAFGER
jgi:hypothetical protein